MSRFGGNVTTRAQRRADLERSYPQLRMKFSHVGSFLDLKGRMANGRTLEQAADDCCISYENARSTIENEEASKDPSRVQWDHPFRSWMRGKLASLFAAASAYVQKLLPAKPKGRPQETCRDEGLAMLAQFGGNQALTSLVLGVNERTLRRWIEEARNDA